MTLPGRGSALSRGAIALADRPGCSLAILVVLIGLSVLGLVREMPGDKLQDSADWNLARETREEFGLDWGSGFVAIFGDVTEPEHEPLVRKIIGAVEELPWVDDVTSPWELPGLSALTLAEALSSELVGGTMVRQEGLLLPFTIHADASRESWDEEAAGIAARVTDGTALEFGITGQSAIFDAQGSAFEGERWRFMGFGALLGFLIASAAFRNVRATFLAGLPPILGVVLSVGLARLVGLGADGFTTIVLPLLVLTIGFADSLHIVVAMVRARREGGALTGAAAASIATGELVWPCLLTSITTAIGFASLSLAGHSLVVEFGLSCAFATAITFVSVILTIPLLARTPLGARLDRVAPPRFDSSPGTAEAEAGGASPAANFVAAVVGAMLRAPRTVATVGALLTIGSVWIASGLEADRRVMSDLAEGSEAADTLLRVDAELGGVFPLHVRMDWDEAATGEELSAVAQSVGEALASEPLFSGVVGPASILRSVATDRSGPGLAPWGALRLVPKRWGSAFFHLDERRALVHARLQDVGSAELIPAFDRTRARLDEIAPPHIRLTLVGDHIAYLEAVDDVTRDLAWSLALAALLILVTLAAAFRSWRLGLASVVPNLLPLGVSAAGLSLSGGHVDISTLTALTLSLGIATDDTIHVLARWERTREKFASAVLAARAAVLQTLPALTMTTLTLTAAFGQLLTSALPTIRDFGLLAGITLVVAFAADALLLPSILVVLDGKRARAAHPGD